MAITPKELTSLVYDPTRMQQLILSNTGNYSINDPTNPFVMLVEAASTLAATAAIETSASLNRLYPSLANKESDIFHHVSDKELVNLFSHPSETNIILYLNIRDIKSQALQNNSLTYYETYIQADTEIFIAGIPFTLFNDIHVKLYDTGTVFAEQMLSTSKLANNSLGIIPAGIVSFQDGEPWLAIETTVKQIKKSVINKTITISEGFYLEVKHTDKYHYIDISFRNAATTNTWVPIKITHSTMGVNPDTPTAYVTVLNQLVTISIPDVYLLSGQVNGEIKIELYETKGYLDLPIYKYQMSEYEVKLNLTTSDPARATISNITVFANSRDVLNGGVDGYTFAELRNSVINNTLGHPNLPITTSQLSKTVATYGFELYNAIDLVTQRTFVATRSIKRYSSSLIQTKPDIYFNTVGIETGAITNAKIIVGVDNILIPSGTIFKETNGVMSIEPDVAYTGIGAIDYSNSNNLFFTPYYYILDTTSVRVTDSRVYDLDTPVLRNIKITGKNVNIIERANIGKYGIIKTPTGYTITMSILSNAEFKLAGINNLMGRLVMPILDGYEKALFTGSYDSATELMTFIINSDLNISIIDQIELTNGIAGVSNVFANLINTSTIYLYTTASSVISDSSNFLVNELGLPTNSTVVFDREEITIEFGNRIKYIWNKMYLTYTPRMYKKYTTDKPLVYKQDDYAVDRLTGSFITTVTDPVTNVISTVRNLLHAKGAPVIDANLNPVFEYRKGDIVTDANNVPVIDLVGGVIRNVDIMMLDYEFLAANTLTHKNYLSIIRDTIKGWLFTNLNDINTKVLENTKVLYRSHRTALPVSITTESINTLVPYIIKPIVSIYSSRSNYSKVEIANLKTEIGYLLHNHLDGSNINLTQLKSEIIASGDSDIISVKLSGIDTYNGSEIFRVTNQTGRLTPNKILQMNDSGELEVIYDIDLRMHLI